MDTRKNIFMKNIFMETHYSVLNRNHSLPYYTLYPEQLLFSLLFQSVIPIVFFCCSVYLT